MQVRNINTASINSITAIARAASAEERATLDALPVLRAQFRGWDREDIKATVQVNWAAVVGVELKVQGSGRIVWPADAGTAKKACNRLIARIMGDSESQRESIEVPPHIAALAAKLVKACGEYEAAGRLLATAVAQAKSGK